MVEPSAALMSRGPTTSQWENGDALVASHWRLLLHFVCSGLSGRRGPREGAEAVPVAARPQGHHPIPRVPHLQWVLHRFRSVMPSSLLSHIAPPPPSAEERDHCPTSPSAWNERCTPFASKKQRSVRTPGSTDQPQATASSDPPPPIGGWVRVGVGGFDPDVPLASATSDMITWSRVLLGHTPDAASSY